MGFNIPADVIAGAKREVEVDDAEAGRTGGHLAKQGGREGVDAGKGQSAAACWVEPDVRRAYLAGSEMGPAHKTHVVVEEQVALGGPVADEQQSLTRLMSSGKLPQVDIAHDVYVMDEDVFSSGEKRLRLFESAASVKQLLTFVADGDVYAEVAVCLKIIDYLTSEMMHIDDDSPSTGTFDSFDRSLQQRLSTHLDQSLGSCVGERFEARAQSGCKNHGLHHCSFFVWRWGGRME